MKKIWKNLLYSFILVIIASLAASCVKGENPIVFKDGIFPDTVVALSGINSEYDDYNADLNTLSNLVPIVFSSNRGSSGGQFDLVQAGLAYTFNQTTGEFFLQFEMTSDPFLLQLLTKTNTTGNDFGPYRLYSSIDGYEYMIISSVNDQGNLDFRYTRNLPYFGTSIPEVSGPFPAVKLNSPSDEAYFCFNTQQDTAYFTSGAGGDFDIVMLKKTASTPVDQWLNSAYETPLLVDVLNSESNDKCPYIYKKYMVFTSDRPGGFGGFDLYYSKFSNGTWSAPVNMGPIINSSSDEYRPVLAGDEHFTNMYMLFSSNRPGGKGGFDLYYAGINLN